MKSEEISKFSLTEPYSQNISTLKPILVSIQTFFTLLVLESNILEFNLKEINQEEERK